MSRFADPKATKRLSLGACQCPGTPHTEDWMELRTEVGAQDYFRIAMGGNLEALKILCVRWNLQEDDTGNPAPVDAEHIDRLFTGETFEPPRRLAQGERQDRAPPKRIRRSLAGYYRGERFPDPESEEGQLLYDIILSRNGWGHDDFRLATPLMIAAARHAVFAEGVAKLLDGAEQVANIELDKHTPHDLRMAKFKASKAIPDLRAALYPEDEPA